MIGQVDQTEHKENQVRVQFFPILRIYQDEHILQPEIHFVRKLYSI